MPNSILVELNETWKSEKLRVLHRVSLASKWWHQSWNPRCGPAILTMLAHNLLVKDSAYLHLYS